MREYPYHLPHHPAQTGMGISQSESHWAHHRDGPAYSTASHQRITPPTGSPLNPGSTPGGSARATPNLLGDDKSALVAGLQFHLSVRQQPRAARACGSGERDRRNIDPPPIVQLHVSGPGVTDEDIDKYLHYEGYVMNCWIYDEGGQRDVSQMPCEYRYQRRLTGSLVSTPFYGRDEFGRGGCFFPFSDLSVRTLGRYRLKFNLIMLNLAQPSQRRHFPILSEAVTDVFDVYTAKEFPGISESSKLVRTLREQGCIISIKKGNDKKKKAKGGDDCLDDDDDDGS